MGRWLDTLERHGTPLSPAQTELYRLAALMHDIGHYPFSHPTERAAKEVYASLKSEPEIVDIPCQTDASADLSSTGDQSLIIHSPNGKTAQDLSDETTFLEHEELGSLLVEIDPELSGIINEFAISTIALQRVFRRHELASHANLLSSDVDADRLDFIRRTAHHTGMPYGQIDQQYLFTELRIDRDGLLCWTEKALSALDQMLLARYFDYQQIVFNKTVVGLELALERIVEYLLHHKMWQLSIKAVKDRINDKTWIDEEDHNLFKHIHDFKEDSATDDTEKEICKSILSRNPPRRIHQLTFTDWQDIEPQFKRLRDKVRLAIPAWARKFGIDQRLWFVWSKAFKFTDWEGGLEIDDAGPEEYAKVPRVLKPGGKSVPIIREPQSLMNSLYAKRRYDLRLYVLLPDMFDPRMRLSAKSVRLEIEKFVASQIEEMDRETIGTRSVTRHPYVSYQGPTLF